jgi:hypothetical protein
LMTVAMQFSEIYKEGKNTQIPIWN